MQRKASQADRMFTHLVAEMNASMAIERAAAFAKTQEPPKWLSTIN
jgi:hypothetical protein